MTDQYLIIFLSGMLAGALTSLFFLGGAVVIIVHVIKTAWKEIQQEREDAN